MSNLIQLRAESIMLLEQLDEVIATVRLLWVDAPPNSKERRHWMTRINQLLDQRLHLMSVRDNHR